MDISITAKQIGRKNAIFEDQVLKIAANDTSISVEDLIRFIVEAQVKKYQTANFSDLENDQTQSPMDNYLSELLITGKAGFGALYNLNEVDVEKAKNNAVQSFEDGQFVIFHGEEQLNTNSSVDLTNTEPFVFLRLTFLTGTIL